jgi:hypothetical protein
LKILEENARPFSAKLLASQMAISGKLSVPSDRSDSIDDHASSFSTVFIVCMPLGCGLVAAGKKCLKRRGTYLP